jgi:hypothetical protein
MEHLTLIVPDGENNLSSIVGAYKIFSRANAFRKDRGKKELFATSCCAQFINPIFHFEGNGIVLTGASHTAFQLSLIFCQ